MARPRKTMLAAIKCDTSLVRRHILLSSSLVLVYERTRRARVRVHTRRLQPRVALDRARAQLLQQTPERVKDSTARKPAQQMFQDPCTVPLR